MPTDSTSDKSAGATFCGCGQSSLGNISGVPCLPTRISKTATREPSCADSNASKLSGRPCPAGGKSREDAPEDGGQVCTVQSGNKAAGQPSGVKGAKGKGDGWIHLQHRTAQAITETIMEHIQRFSDQTAQHLALLWPLEGVRRKCTDRWTQNMAKS